MEKIRSLAKTKLIPMVKGDAYGNGMVPVSRFLVEECGEKKLGCASLGEALTLFQEARMALQLALNAEAASKRKH